MDMAPDHPIRLPAPAAMNVIICPMALAQSLSQVFHAYSFVCIDLICAYGLHLYVLVEISKDHIIESVTYLKRVSVRFPDIKILG